MVDVSSMFAILPIPMSLGGIVSLVVNVILMVIVLMLVDYVIAHGVEFKHSLIMAFGAYFVAPIVVSVTGLAGYFDPLVAVYIIPLVVWIILGELLLKKASDAKKKALIAIIAFVIYVAMTAMGVPFMIQSMIPF